MYESKLDKLAIKYNTDKSSLAHNYIEFYERVLPEKPKKLLEIGCLKGASIRMWKDYFPHTEIHTLDLFSDNIIPDIKGVKFWKGNQIDHVILDQLRGENFDIIIDDGSHNSRDQLVTFYSLFNGGHYFVEDLHCCTMEFYRGGLPYELTLLGQLTGGLFPMNCILDMNKIVLIHG